MFSAAICDLDTSSKPDLSPVSELAAQCANLFALDTDLMLLNRPTRPNWLSELAELNASDLTEMHFEGLSADLGNPLETALRQSAQLTDGAAAWLVQDILRLAALMSQFFGSPNVKLRLEVVTDDACRKFHIDNVVSRLICTYCGPGTQFSSNPDNTDAAPIWQAPTGVPVLLKGRKWPQTAPLSVAHRSPPIAHTGVVRWVLVLEPVISQPRVRDLSAAAQTWTPQFHDTSRLRQCQ